MLTFANTTKQLSEIRNFLCYKPKVVEGIIQNIYDKVGRFESHAQVLRKCLEHKIVPKGLQVYVEPSIGNRDDEFLNKWHSRLEEFGRLLTTDVIEFSEKTIRVTKEEIKNTEIALKSQTDANQYKTLKSYNFRQPNYS